MLYAKATTANLKGCELHASMLIAVRSRRCHPRSEVACTDRLWLRTMDKAGKLVTQAFCGIRLHGLGAHIDLPSFRTLVLADEMMKIGCTLY